MKQNNLESFIWSECSLQ